MRVLGLLLAFLVTSCGSTYDSTSNKVTYENVPTGDNQIMRVVDGDTIDVFADGHTQRVRLIGVNTPERNECYGPQASTTMESMLPVGTVVRLVDGVDDTDKYGRRLAYVYRVSDNAFINLELAVQGYAKVMTIQPNNLYAHLFVTAVERAKINNIGLWKECR